MTEIQISRADIDDLAQQVDTLALSQPPKALLSAIVAAIRDVAVQEPLVKVTVDIVALQDGFGSAFTPDPEQENAAAAHIVTVTVTKIGRGPA
jgi:hypothetical protein